MPSGYRLLYLKRSRWTSWPEGMFVPLFWTYGPTKPIPPVIEPPSAWTQFQYYGLIYVYRQHSVQYEGTSFPAWASSRLAIHPLTILLCTCFVPLQFPLSRVEHWEDSSHWHHAAQFFSLTDKIGTLSVSNMMYWKIKIKYVNIHLYGLWFKSLRPRTFADLWTVMGIESRMVSNKSRNVITIFEDNWFSVKQGNVGKEKYELWVKCVYFKFPAYMCVRFVILEFRKAPLFLGSNFNPSFSPFLTHN